MEGLSALWLPFAALHTLSPPSVRCTQGPAGNPEQPVQLDTHQHTHTLTQGLSVAYCCARSHLTLQTSFSVIMKHRHCLMLPHVLSAAAIRKFLLAQCQFQQLNTVFFIMLIQVISIESTLFSSCPFTYRLPWHKHYVLPHLGSPS